MNTTIKRLAFRAQCRSGQKEKLLALAACRLPVIQQKISAGAMLTASLYQWGDQLFWYGECVDGEIHPDELFGPASEFLETWPGEPAQRYWVPMIDVFHFNEPAGKEQWQRKSPPGRRIGKVARLRPDKVASYIYFHYQLQEEQAFGGEKYKFITLHENLLFLYDETPPVIERPAHPPRLSTTGTPKNWEETRMDLHFIPWDEQRRFFQEIDPVFTL